MLKKEIKKTLRKKQWKDNEKLILIGMAVRSFNKLFFNLQIAS